MYQKSLLPPIPQLPPQNVTNLMLRRPDQEAWPDFTIQVDLATGKTRKFKEYRERIALGATAIAELNLTSDMVGLLSDNCLDYYVIVNSLLTITTPYALLPSHSKPFELVHLLKLSKVSWLFVQPEYLDSALIAAEQVGLSPDRILALEGNVKGRRSFDDLIRDVQERKVVQAAVRPADKNTLAYLVFSSGTTGLPKGVMISHGNIQCALLQNIVSQQIEMAKDTDPPKPFPTKEGLPTVLAYLPLYHSYGLHVYVFRGVFAPMTMLSLPKWDVEGALKAIPEYPVTHMTLVPSVIHQFVTHPKFDTLDWSSVVAAGSGAAYLPADLAKRFSKRLGVDHFGGGYGLSEATIGVATRVRNGVLPVNLSLDAVGVLLSSQESRIVREDGTDAGLNEPGELWVRGDNVAMGYYGNEKATRETFTPDGWLKTGDKLKIDANGIFYFEDRAKDTLKVSGSQVSPTEIESALRAHPDHLIIDVSVAGVTGGRTSDEKVPRAWIVLSEEGKRRGEVKTIEALNVWVQENLTKYKWLRGGIEVINEIPKTVTGKVLRRVLQDNYEAQHGEVKGKL